MFFVTLMGMLLAAVAETTAADGSTARMVLGTAAMTVAPAAAASLFALFVGLRTRKLDAEAPLQSTAFKDFARRYARIAHAHECALSWDATPCRSSFSGGRPSPIARARAARPWRTRRYA